MRKRLLITLAGATLMSVLVLLLLASGAMGQTDPPASGDWTVADTTVVSDQTVDLRDHAPAEMLLDVLARRRHLCKQQDGEGSRRCRGPGQ